jgi:3-methyladenine DNA glycosylase AlkD
VTRRLRALADPVQAAALQRFFKTGPGEYAEGDRFLGVKVPAIRTLAREYRALPLDETARLLRSPWHEARTLALVILVRQYARADEATRARIHRLYLDHTAYINNWDLVDGSAEHIVGAHLADGRRTLLRQLANSRSVWERRIAVMATFHFIKLGEFEETLALAERLLDDPHDLIHKAVGWMLREVGKRDRAAEEAFLRAHAARMPRTMLRYAIEKFPEPLRRRYLDMKRNEPRNVPRKSPRNEPPKGTTGGETEREGAARGEGVPADLDNA